MSVLTWEEKDIMTSLWQDVQAGDLVGREAVQWKPDSKLTFSVIFQLKKKNKKTKIASEERISKVSCVAQLRCWLSCLKQTPFPKNIVSVHTAALVYFTEALRGKWRFYFYDDPFS